MDETQDLVEKIVHATEQRKLKWEYDSSDSTTTAKAAIGQGKIKLEWSCPGVKDLRQNVVEILVKSSFQNVHDIDEARMDEIRAEMEYSQWPDKD